MGEEGLRSSIVDLCQPFSCSTNPSEFNDSSVKRESVVADVPVKTEEDSHEIIDLTFDTKEEVDDQQECGLMTSAYNAEAGPSQLPTVPADPVKVVLHSNPAEMNLGFFCEDERHMELEDILWRLTKNQLMELVKSTRCQLRPKPQV